MAWNGLGYIPIKFYLPNRTFIISAEVLQRNVPSFPYTFGPAMPVEHFHRRWSKSWHKSWNKSWSPSFRKAYDVLLAHLEELSSHDSSGAILHHLEFAWSTYFPSRPDTITWIFSHLGHLLFFSKADHSLTSYLRTFFLRHCDAIFAHSIPNGLVYLQTLDALSLQLDDVVACITRKPSIADALLDAEQESYDRGKRRLSSKLRGQLEQLAMQRKESRQGKGRELVRCGGYELGIRGGGGHGRGMHGLVPAKTYHPQKVADIVNFEPERVFIAPSKHDYVSRGRYFDNEDDDSSSYDGDEHEYGEYGRRRGRIGWDVPARRRIGPGYGAWDGHPQRCLDCKPYNY
ncbi:hypothetical protein MMC13_008400 [Lambiella insularis]|nr:hypothetical protein [Lambiella insularis]